MISETSALRAIALAGQGQNVSEIARHLGHDRKTIRIYLNGHRAPGQPRPHADSFAPFAAYIRQRADDDPHLRSTGLHRETAALGYAGSYSAFTRELRGHGITAACGTCRKWRPIAPVRAREDCPGPLPFRTGPLSGETIASYLARVAAASHLPAGAVTGCLPPWFAARDAACDDLAATGQPQPADIRHLAALTGTSETALRHALPALVAGGRPPVRAIFACQHCVARHGQRSPVPVHIPAHQRACRRHRTWLGRIIQIDITTAPDITAASKKASQLAREYGITRLVLAEITARQGTTGGPDAQRRAAALALASPGLDPGHPDTAEAAAYPETVKAAAALLRTPGTLPSGPE
ncbi:MAG: hypothetical protein ACRDND_18500 [Streptosporangiaceae bacterium]